MPGANALRPQYPLLPKRRSGRARRLSALSALPPRNGIPATLWPATFGVATGADAKTPNRSTRKDVRMTSEIATRTFGTVSADQRKEMTGLEFVQGLANRTLPLNTIAKTLGYDVTEAEAGRVVVAITPTADHLNPAGTVHGGLTATLLDSCMGLAVQSTLEKDMSQTTLEFKISLLRPITPETGAIRAEGVVLSRGRRIGTAEGRLTDSEGRLLAHGTTTCLIFPS
jgi:uncharacterized protein (TIGR00369 family)